MQENYKNIAVVIRNQNTLITAASSFAGQSLNLAQHRVLSYPCTRHKNSKNNNQYIP